MEETVGKRISKIVDGERVEFGLSDAGPNGSPVRADVRADVPSADAEASAGLDTADAATRTPEFLELASPKLPNLTAHGNQARLLMQSPGRLYFYWAMAKNPFHTLNRALGQADNYTLVLRLRDLKNGTEEIHPVGAAGDWWFSVHANGEYQAEIGFYAVNRPYIRILNSNTVSTPRKGPSPRLAETAEWRIPADRFAKVLDASGFARDAFDVALAGDDVEAAEIATRSAFAQFSGRRYDEFSSVEADEIRYAMLALASGLSLEQLRGLIGEGLFAILSDSRDATAERALVALKERFEFDADDLDVEEEDAEPVFGASSVNFPKRLKRRGPLPALNPVSSGSPRR